MKCYVSRGKGSSGGCLRWLPHCWKASTSSHRSRGWFSKAGLLVFFIYPKGLGTTGAVWKTRYTPSPLIRLHLSGLLGFKHKPDHLRSSSRIVRHCIATDLVLPRLHWDIWSYSGCHLFLRRDRSQNWDPWYAHLSAALVAARHVMWQTKLCTQYYLKFPIKDEQKECVRGWVVIRFFHFI